MYLHFSNTKLRHLFFKSSEDLFLLKPIGKVVSAGGQVSRQKAMDTEFTSLTLDELVYPQDTLMTGSESTIVVELSDGRKVELSPNSLIKLNFELDFSVGGIVQKSVVTVLTGSKTETVKLKSATVKDKEDFVVKPVVVAPVPLKVWDLSPPTGTYLEVTWLEYVQQKKLIVLGFKYNNSNKQLKVNVKNLDTGQAVSTLVTHTRGDLADVVFELNPAVHPPGNYEWFMQDWDGKISARSSFKVESKIGAIETHQTLADNRIKGRATKEKFEGFLLRWKPLVVKGNVERGSVNKSYVVRIYRLEDNHLLLQKEVHSSQLLVNSTQLTFGKKLYYTVQKDLGNKYFSVSGKQIFGFEFLSPKLKLPAPNMQFTKEVLIKHNQTVFFTWGKTNYTTDYEFELALDNGFASPLLKRILKTNLQTATALSPGTYYWRVRSLSKGRPSAYSETRNFQVLN